MGRENGGSSDSIGLKTETYNTGKGVIVDSGTTDTYLPRTVTATWWNGGVELNRQAQHTHTHSEGRHREDIPCMFLVNSTCTLFFDFLLYSCAPPLVSSSLLRPPLPPSDRPPALYTYTVRSRSHHPSSSTLRPWPFLFRWPARSKPSSKSSPAATTGT